MIFFNSDYMAGAHPKVLKALNDTNLIKSAGYGFDSYTEAARMSVLKACGLEDGFVFFLQGGTQTNKTVIDRLLSRNDGVLCCDSAHINVHEAGAIEADGHKVIPLAGKDGKVDAPTISRYVEEFYNDDTNGHMVRPAMVYISHPTEFGTLYTRNELADISEVCKKHGMPLYLDGARLAYGLAAEGTDVTLHDIATLTDVFYIGGTKCGALFGEAVVARQGGLLPRFMSLVKLHGALLAKGRLLGVQFQALFADGLYYRIGREAVRLAMILKEGFMAKGYRQYIDSPTNQQFFILPDSTIDRLRENAGFDLWGPRGEKESVARFVTDWTTAEEDVSALLSLL